MHLVPPWIIEKKRDGGTLSTEEIRAFLLAYADGSLPDYQMAALAMAIYLRGMDPAEVAALTQAMMDSGEVVDTSGIAAPKVDKHSTGGIGDKVSLILAPLAAACGVAVPMIAGRGLGITGGTVDKMESIAGYRTDLSVDDFLRVVDTCGCSIIGQTAVLAPADKKLYALRDVTATVPSIPLITASIMCKKLAEGLDALVLDVKSGRGAFMRDPEHARALAQSMITVGREMGVPVTSLLTDMDEPLGRTVGHAVEVAESVRGLRGEGPADLMEVTLALTARMVMHAHHIDEPEALTRVREALDSGRGLQLFADMVRLHGGDPGFIDDPTRLPRASHVTELPAPSDGVVVDVDPERIGRGVQVLGAGRRQASDGVDHAVGISDLVKTGERVVAGQPLLRLHWNHEAARDEALAFLEPAVRLGDQAPTRNVILETLYD